MQYKKISFLSFTTDALRTLKNSQKEGYATHLQLNYNSDLSEARDRGSQHRFLTRYVDKFNKT